MTPIENSPPNIICLKGVNNNPLSFYNKAFERTRLKDLTGLYPDLRKHLMNINYNIIDLTDNEKIDIVAAKVLKVFKTAFLKFAK